MPDHTQSTDSPHAALETPDAPATPLQAIIHSAMDAIITTDEEQRVLIFNVAAEKMFGCPAEAALGQSLGLFIPHRFRAAHAEQVRFFAATGGTCRKMGMLGNVRGVRSDGEEIQLQISISTAEFNGKKLFTAILRQITEP